MSESIKKQARCVSLHTTRAYRAISDFGIPNPSRDEIDKSYHSINFVCPECGKNFGDDASALGPHIVSHEEYLPKGTHKYERRCPKGCGRFLRLSQGGGDFDWHIKLCRGIRNG